MVTIKFTFRGNPIELQVSLQALAWVVIVAAQLIRIIWPGHGGGAA